MAYRHHFAQQISFDLSGFGVADGARVTSWRTQTGGGDQYVKGDDTEVRESVFSASFATGQVQTFEVEGVVLLLSLGRRAYSAFFAAFSAFFLAFSRARFEGPLSSAGASGFVVSAIVCVCVCACVLVGLKRQMFERKLEGLSRVSNRVIAPPPLFAPQRLTCTATSKDFGPSNTIMTKYVPLAMYSR